MRIIRQSHLTCLGIVLLRKLRIKCHFHLLWSVYRSFDCFVNVYLTECCRQVLMLVFLRFLLWCYLYWRSYTYKFFYRRYTLSGYRLLQCNNICWVSKCNALTSTQLYSLVKQKQEAMRVIRAMRVGKQAYMNSHFSTHNFSCLIKLQLIISRSWAVF